MALELAHPPGDSTVRIRKRWFSRTEIVDFAAGLPRSLHASLGGRRLVILLPFAVIFGILAGETLAAPPSLTTLLAIALPLAAVTLWPDASGRRQRTGLILISFWIGVALLPVHARLFGAPLIDWPVYGLYLASVDEVPDGGAPGQRLLLSTIQPLGWSPSPAVKRARLTVKGGSHFAPGDRILAAIRFAPVPAPVLPDAFDTRMQAFFEGIGAYGTTTKLALNLGNSGNRPLERVIYTVRQAVADRVDSVLGAPEAGIARSLINGDQSAVDDDTRTLLATAGLAHVLSVSGLHLSLVAGIAMWIARLAFSLFRMPFSAKAGGAIVAILAALGYFALSGGNVAAERSTLMILLVLGAVLLGRQAISMRNVALAALALLLLEPASLFRPGFQLSFAAVVGLVGLFELWPPRRSDGLFARIGAFFVGLVVSSLVAGLATLPFSMVHFRQIAPLGLLANLIGLPLVSFATMPMAVLSAVLMPLGGEAIPLSLLGLSIDGLLAIARFVTGLGSGLGTNPLLTPLALLLTLCGLAVFAVIETRHRLWGPILILFTVPLCALGRLPDVIIADTTEAVAIRGAQSLALVSGKPQTFAVNIWREAFLDPIPTEPMSCTKRVCTGESPLGFTVAILRGPVPQGAPCPRADLIIARKKAPADCEGLLIDARLLRRAGTQLLYWQPEERRFTRRPAIPKVNRPWRAGQS